MNLGQLLRQLREIADEASEADLAETTVLLCDMAREDHPTADLDQIDTDANMVVLNGRFADEALCTCGHPLAQAIGPPNPLNTTCCPWPGCYCTNDRHRCPSPSPSHTPHGRCKI